MGRRVGSLLLSLSLIVASLWVLSTKRAYAYIDPGSASFLFQALLASLFASLFAIKVFWQRLTVGISVVRARMLTVAQAVGGIRRADR